MMLTVVPIFLLVLCCHTLLCPCATTQTMAANEVNPNQHFSSNPTKRATSPLQKSLHMEAEILCEPCIPCCFFQATAVCIHKFTKIWIEKGQSQNRAVCGKVSKASNESKF